VLELNDLTKEELLDLLTDGAKLWLAHDGFWFQEVEKAYGLAKAVELDENAMALLTVTEAKRIKERFKLPENGGLDALDQALRMRMYARVNRQTIERPDERTLIFKMVDCRVQAARARKNMPEHPCKSVGILEYSKFAATIDQRIKTRCLGCPPGEHPPEFWCGWEFTV